MHILSPPPPGQRVPLYLISSGGDNNRLADSQWNSLHSAIDFALFPYPHRVKGLYMTATGELIRMMNYVDDIAATLRRINASLYLITPEEKRRLAEYMRKSDPNFLGVVEQLEKGA